MNRSPVRALLATLQLVLSRPSCSARCRGDGSGTILNLHGILANNLLPDQRAAGRLRRIGAGINGFPSSSCSPQPKAFQISNR
jgi:hypothetical protein